MLIILSYFISFKGELKSYWIQTARLDSIQTIIEPVLSVQLIKVLAQLYEGSEIEVGQLSTKVNYEKSFDIRLILCFLVHVGYLTYKKGKVSMPNREIKCEWKNCSFGVADSESMVSPFQRTIINALRKEPFAITSLKIAMSEKLLSCSYFDFQRENSYHLFYFGIFNADCGPCATSNREAGHGRYDIEITLIDMKRLFIFEFKHSKNECDLEVDASKGLKQIHEKKYYQDEQYNGWTCFAIGVSFFKKEISELKYEQFQVVYNIS